MYTNIMAMHECAGESNTHSFLCVYTCTRDECVSTASLLTQYYNEKQIATDSERLYTQTENATRGGVQSTNAQL